jgi:two-component system, LuxR family, response regulator FixJ
MTVHSVFIVDDDDAVRDSLLTLLRVQGIRARGFASGKEFFANLPDEASACVVTDVRMPEMDGIEVVRRLAEAKGHAWPVIVITGHADVPLVIQMMKSGVVDFIEKPFDPSRLIEAVQGCIGHLSELMQAQEARQATQAKVDQLTPREAQVFHGLIEGKSNKEIAMELDISPRTVEIFRAKVMDKMQAGTLSALVRMGLILAGPSA